MPSTWSLSRQTSNASISNLWASRGLKLRMSSTRSPWHQPPIRKLPDNNYRPVKYQMTARALLTATTMPLSPIENHPPKENLGVIPKLEMLVWLELVSNVGVSAAQKQDEEMCQRGRLRFEGVCLKYVLGMKGIYMNIDSFATLVTVLDSWEFYHLRGHFVLGCSNHLIELGNSCKASRKRNNSSRRASITPNSMQCNHH